MKEIGNLEVTAQLAPGPPLDRSLVNNLLAALQVI